MARPQNISIDLLAEELALLAHDIRASLADVLAGLELMDRSTFPPQELRQLDRVQAAGEGLARLLNSALARVLGTPSEASELAPVHLHGLLNDLMRRWAYSSQTAGGACRLSLSTAAELPDVIMCNQVALERVLSNLISNALTHSDESLVTLAVHRASTTELCFRITDKGPGFPEAICTEPTPDQTVGRGLPAWHTNEGHGLGLSISYALARSMGARISLRNGTRGGAEALVRLPLLSPPRMVPSALPDIQAEFAGLKVLLADDSATQLLSLSLYFEQLGVQLTMVRDGVSALSALQSGGFEAAFLDHDMPGLTGPQVCAKLADTSTGTPVILLSAHHLESGPALASGAALVLSKPVHSTETLAKALQTVMNSPQSIKMTSTHPPINPDEFQRLLDIAGPEMATELIARFQADLAEVNGQIRNAVEPLHWKNLQDASHVLCALAGTAGAHALADIARAFNAASAGRDSKQVQQNAPYLLQGLGGLIDFVDKIAAERQS